MPTAKAEVLKTATPEPFTATVASVVAPSLKSTLPGEVPTPGLTVAVKVTSVPGAEGLTELLNATELVPIVTVWVKGAEVLAAKFGSAPGL